MNTYRRLPVTFTHGQGAWLIDRDGKRYLDGLSGIGVNAVGHAHPALITALTHQIGRLIHVSNCYRIAEQEVAAAYIARLSGMDRVFFCNSGAEANEGLIKLSRLHARARGIADPTVVVMEGAFHGRTMSTLAATGNARVQAGFEPLPSGFLRVPYGDVTALEALKDNPNIVAVLLETVQGEGGVRIAEFDYLRAVRKLCADRQWLMMIDEIQTGIGRTGTWFGYRHAGILPDAVSLAKGLGGGVPIGAFAAVGAAAEYFKPGQHGSTFGGNPLACAAVVATLKVIEDENLLSNAAERGAQIVEQLQSALAGLDEIVDIRGLGLMIGVELDRPCAEIVPMALEAGLLINVTAERVVRLLPPLILTPEEAGDLAARVAETICAFYAKQTG